MNFLRLGRKKKKLDIKADSVLALTEEGKQVAEGQKELGKGYAILEELQDRSFREVGEICEEVDIDIGEAREAIRGLAARGFIRIYEERKL